MTSNMCNCHIFMNNHQAYAKGLCLICYWFCHITSITIYKYAQLVLFEAILDKCVLLKLKFIIPNKLVKESA